jgi:hypothetical protein
VHLTTADATEAGHVSSDVVCLTRRIS